MTCTHCGTEIAEKALVCYRCGQATIEPRVRPGDVPKRRSRVPVVVGLLVLVLGALVMSQVAVGRAPQVASWVVAGLACVVLVWQLGRRRR